MLLKILSIFVILNVVHCQETTGDSTNYCLSEDPEPYLTLGSTTSYKIINDPPESYVIKDYEPVQFWILSRHGSRHANPTILDNMKTVVTVKDAMATNSPNGFCPKDLEKFKKWKWNTTVESLPYELHLQGWNDLKDLAIRYKSRYPTLLGGTYSPEDFYFRHTLRNRTMHSCQAFVDGLFGDGSYKTTKIETPLVHDIIIRPFSMCDKWFSGADRKNVVYPEQIVFYKSKKFVQLKSDISKRFGFEEDLSTDLILAMFDTCRFETTKHPEDISPWCAVFTKDQGKLLEYHSDLLQYYEGSYGFEHNFRFGCFPLQHLRETFEKTVENNIAQPKTSVLLSHEIMFDMVYAALNFSKDDKHLPGEDYDYFVKNRKYRTSFNTPFTCNIAVVLQKSKIEENKYKVQILLNEKPMNMEMANCEDGLCDWDTFKNYISFTNHCSLEFCNNKNPYVN